MKKDGGIKIKINLKYIARIRYNDVKTIHHEKT